MTKKDPIAAELGRRGGIKGGKARSMSLSPERRREIARRAAAARWGAKAAGGAPDGDTASLPGVASAIRRGTMQLDNRSFAVFALADGRRLLGLLSVEEALASDGPTVRAAVDTEASIVSFKEAGSWRVAKGVAPADFLAICRRLGREMLSRRAEEPELLDRVWSMLVDCASDGLEHRVELALTPS